MKSTDDKKISRAGAANRVVAELKGPTTLQDLAAKADAMFVSGGGEANARAAVQCVRHALDTAEVCGVVKITKPTDILIEPVKAGA